jgi:valyl-tRNA synthetase
MKYPGKFFQQQKICTLRPQGKEIVRNWLYYTLLRCYQLLNRSIFRDVWLHYHVVDDKGKKMSKSIGNVIDPHEILERYGAEPFRFWCAVEGNLDKQDFRCSFERIEGAGKTLTKLWNVARFVSMLPQTKSKKIKIETDRWIISEMNTIIKYSKEQYSKYDFHNPVIKLRHFLWETFASHYLELAKSRAYNQSGAFSKEEQESALHALNYCLENVLRLLAPVVPMFSQKIYNDIYKKNIHDEKFPVEKLVKSKIKTQDIENLNSFIWKGKKDKGLSLKSEIKELVLPKKYSPIAKDIVACHNVVKLKYGSVMELVL